MSEMPIYTDEQIEEMRMRITSFDDEEHCEYMKTKWEQEWRKQELKAKAKERPVLEQLRTLGALEDRAPEKITVGGVEFVRIENKTTISQKNKFPLMEQTIYKSEKTEFGRVKIPPQKTQILRNPPPPFVKNPNFDGSTMRVRGGVTEHLWAQSIPVTPPALYSVKAFGEEKIPPPSIGFLDFLRGGIPECLPGQKGRPINIAVDCEWETVQPLNGGFERNVVVSHQFAVAVDGAAYLFFFTYPGGRLWDACVDGEQYRLALNTVLNHVLECLHLKGLIDIDYISKSDWTIYNTTMKQYRSYHKHLKLVQASPGDYPNFTIIDGPEKPRPFENARLQVNLVGHNLKADLAGFYQSDVTTNWYSKGVDLSGGFVGLLPFATNLWDTTRNKTYLCSISVRDTMSLLPGGSKGLEAVGDIINVPKMSLDAGWIKKMLWVWVNHPKTFIEYALNDALVTLLYCCWLQGVNMPIGYTLPSLGGDFMYKRLMELYYGGDKERYNREYRGLQKVVADTETVVDNEGKIRYLENTSLEPISSDVRTLLTFAANSYHGGYNQCFTHGFIDGTTYDLDLSSAYPVAISLIKDIDYSQGVVMYRNVELTLDMIDDVTVPGFFAVDFEFPRGAEPCITMAADGSLVYPRTGVDVYCSVVEVYLALQQGARVFARFGMFGKPLMSGAYPTHAGSVLKQMIEDRANVVGYYGKKSPEEMLVKEATNSVSGKMGQGVHLQRKYNPIKNSSEDLPPSNLTNPVIIAMATSYVRCVLIAVIKELRDLGYQVHSVTTDGFITNAPLAVVDKLEGYGLVPKFRLMRKMLAGDENIWSCKHTNDGFLNLCTRGNVAPNNEGVVAMGGYKTEADKKSPEGREEFFKKAASRVGAVAMTYKAFPTHRFLNNTIRSNDINKDYLPITVHKTIRLDHDIKRKPIINTAVDRTFTAYNTNYSNVYFDTEPFETIEEWQTWKKAKELTTVLKTRQDLLYLKAKAEGVRVATGEALERQKIMSLIKGIRSGEIVIQVLDIKKYTGNQILLVLKRFLGLTIDLTINDWKNAGRKTRQKSSLDKELFQDYIDKLNTLETVDIDKILTTE